MSLDRYIKDVKEFDNRYDLNDNAKPTMANLAFFSNALAGEVGEFCNIVKKIWRDGETPERLSELDEELVDIMIYFIEILRTLDTDFQEAWYTKQQDLIERWEEHKNNPNDYNEGYRIEDFLLDLNRK